MRVEIEVESIDAPDTYHNISDRCHNVTIFLPALPQPVRNCPVVSHLRVA